MMASVMFLNSTEVHCAPYGEPSSQPLPPVSFSEKLNDLLKLPSQLVEKSELGIGLLPPNPAHLAYAVWGISRTSQQKYPGLESGKEV